MATTRQLRDRGIDRMVLDIAAMYELVLRVRKGLWAAPDIPPLVVAAQRAGGRLACVSALAYHGIIDDAESGLHICAPPGVIGWHPSRRGDRAVRHWSRSPLDGDAFAVSADLAWAQFGLCRAVASSDVHLA